MEQEKQSKRIAYALDFVSFLVEHNVKLKRAILFGSIVTKEFDEESDIDIFLETEEEEENIQKLLSQFERTKGENLRLKGVENPISLKVGKLEKWSQLRRNIQSHGLLLYGKFREIPEKIESYMLFILNFKKLKRAKKISMWRKLYGYIQKVNNRKYIQKGWIAELNGRKLERSVVAIPAQNTPDFRHFLNKNKIDYKIYEVWSDNL